jgi:hypothetical protein
MDAGSIGVEYLSALGTLEAAGFRPKVWAGAEASLWEMQGLMTVIRTVIKPAIKLRAIGALS